MVPAVGVQDSAEDTEEAAGKRCWISSQVVNGRNSKEKKIERN